MAVMVHHPFHIETDLDYSSIDPFLLSEDFGRYRKISMVDSNIFNIPISPPTSPHLSGYQSESIESTWAEPPKSLEATHVPESNMTLVHSEIPNLTLDTKPMLRSHKTYPFPMGAGVPDTPPLNGSDESPNTANPEDLSSGLEMPSADLSSATFGSPDSPLDHMSPGDDDDLDGDLGLNINLGEDENGEKRTLSAAELRAQKRKMKRFRLTHNQTRFLMSEFARQAHPDAAHRERLAREIPGLTPRQVQVWFQNRYVMPFILNSWPKLSC
jgi:Homeodomain